MKIVQKWKKNRSGLPINTNSKISNKIKKTSDLWNSLSGSNSFLAWNKI